MTDTVTLESGKKIKVINLLQVYNKNKAGQYTMAYSTGSGKNDVNIVTITEADIFRIKAAGDRSNDVDVWTGGEWHD